jgi:hypothetical protein
VIPINTELPGVSFKMELALCMGDCEPQTREICVPCAKNIADAVRSAIANLSRTKVMQHV